MKKILALLLALVMALSLCACGAKDNSANNTESKQLSDEQQTAVDAVAPLISADYFAKWQELYKQFSGNDAKAPKVESGLHYHIDDFNGVAVDYTLIHVSADIAYWMNEEAQQGSIVEGVNLLIDTKSNTVYDSINTDAGNFDGDTSDDEGKAMYILWMYGIMVDGSYEGNFLNDTETVEAMSEADIAAINSALSK